MKNTIVLLFYSSVKKTDKIIILNDYANLVLVPKLRYVAQIVNPWQDLKKYFSAHFLDFYNCALFFFHPQLGITLCWSIK